MWATDRQESKSPCNGGRKYLSNIIDPEPDTVFGVRYKLSLLPYGWRKKPQNYILQAGHLDAATILDFMKLERSFI